MTSWRNIPGELQRRAQWVLWRRVTVDGRLTKVLYQASQPSRTAAVNRPATWSSFEAAVAASSVADGIGFVITESDPYVGFDLDAGLDEADRQWIVTTLNSYTELSPSGADRRHVICRASKNGHTRCRDQGLEVYEKSRFFTMTGLHMLGTPAMIMDRQAEVDEVLDRYLPTRVVDAGPRPVELVDVDDQELLDRAVRARNGERFDRLYYQGDTSGYSSQSEADQALASMLAFWTGRDADRIDHLFRCSALMREKWQRVDYRASTITRAITGTANTYQPKGRRIWP